MGGERERGGLGGRGTEEAGVGGHVGAVEHLGEAAEGLDDAFDDLKGRLGALAEAVCQAVGIVHARLPGIAAHASVHAAAVHGAVASAVHGVAHTAVARVGG